MSQPGTIRVGIGGWVYPPWRGTFYPPGLPQAQELAYASRHVTAIEINGTFYNSGKPDSFRKWRDATPENFVFSLKGPRFVTHRSRWSTPRMPASQLPKSPLPGRRTSRPTSSSASWGSAARSLGSVWRARPGGGPRSLGGVVPRPGCATVCTIAVPRPATAMRWPGGMCAAVCAAVRTHRSGDQRAAAAAVEERYDGRPVVLVDETVRVGPVVPDDHSAAAELTGTCRGPPW